MNILSHQIPVCMIGIAGYGEKLSKLIANNPDLKLYSCYHPNITKAAAYSETYGCNAFSTIKKSTEGVQAIVIATPDYTHYEYIDIAIDAKLHIFVEKPMVQTLQEARVLEKKLQNYESVFMVGHNMRHEKVFRYIKKEIESGELGRLVSFQIFLSHGGAFNWDSKYWRSSEDLCAEGPLRVNGVHGSDILEYLFGPIESVTAKMSSEYTKHGAPDSGAAMVKIGAAVGTIYTNWVTPSMNRFLFQFTNATIDIDEFSKITMRKGRDIDCQKTPDLFMEFSRHDSKSEQLAEFVESVRDERKPETGLKEGIRALMFVEACNMSNEKGREVFLEELV